MLGETMAALDIAAIYERHVSMVYRVCYSYLGVAADAEDAVQEVFIKLLDKQPQFVDDEHERRWLIRVAANHCKDMLRRSSRKNVPLEKVLEPAARKEGFDSTLDVVLKMDPKYKDVVYLYYYEGYTTDEVAEIVGRPPSTVRSHLSEARAILRKQLGGDWR